MGTTSLRSLSSLIVALGGVFITAIGLTLAALSDPRRFSTSPANDRTIDLLALLGFGLTLVGLFLFLAAARNTTKRMPRHLRSNANAGVGFGLLLQLAGAFLPETGLISVVSGYILLLASLPAFLWGTISYAQGKGYPKWPGLLGLLGVVGLIVLVLLPGRELSSGTSV